jgi:uncharacterized membrane protein
MKKSNNHHRDLFLALGISLVFAASYSTIAIKKYAAHQTRGDLTAYAQGMWNTLDGNFMASTFNYSVHNFWDGHFREIVPQNSNIFGIHFNPIILFILPFFAIYPSPITLLIIQALVLAGSSVVIYLLARSILNNKLVAYVIQFSYLLHLALISASLSEFHAYPLTVLFSSLLIWFSYRKSNTLFYFSLLLLLLVQENASIPTFFFGLYLMLDKSNRIRGLITSVVGLVYLLVSTKLIIPMFSPTGAYLFETAYGSPLGWSYLEMIKNTLLHPQLFITTIFSVDNLVYLGKIILPVIPFALFAPYALIAGILTLTPNLISSASILKTLSMHYEAVSVPYLYYALILGILFTINHLKIKKEILVVAISIIIVVATTIQYKLITSARFSPTCVWSCRFYSELDAEKDQVIASIPKDSSVSTQDYLSGHFSDRPGLYLFPVYFDRADYVVISNGEESWPLSKDDQLVYIAKLNDSQNHTISFETDHFIAFKKSP